MLGVKEVMDVMLMSDDEGVPDTTGAAAWEPEAMTTSTDPSLASRKLSGGGKGSGGQTIEMSAPFSTPDERSMDVPKPMDAVRPHLGAVSIHPSRDSPQEQRQKMNKVGYLEMRAGTVMGTWQRRYCVLEDSMLTIYKHHTDVGVKFSRQLEMLGVTVNDSMNQPTLDTMEFTVTVGTECVLLRSSSPSETVSWVHSVRYCAAVLEKRKGSGQISAHIAGKVSHISSESVAIEDIYEMGDVLGAGVAGTVFRAVHRGTGQVCAIKVLSKRKFLRSARGRVTVTRELQILTTLSECTHPHVVQLQVRAPQPAEYAGVQLLLMLRWYWMMLICSFFVAGDR